MSKKMLPLPRRPFAIAIGGALCAGLVGGVVSPAWSSEPAPGGGQSPVVGGFGLGDALEAFVEQRDGAATFQLAVGGLALSWDSRAAGDDRFGFGPGWGLGLAHVTTEGGVRVHLASGGSYEVDATHPSGLEGYGTHDVKFRAVGGQLPARDGAGDALAYSYELHELGGTVTYFDDAGDPVASISPTGLRTDWVLDRGEPRRLLAVVDGDGVRTELDWEQEPGTIVIRSGANLGAGTQEWRVRVTPTGLTVIDPVGQETQVTQDGTGLVTRLNGGTGAVTDVTWHPADDGVPRVAEVLTVDASSAELSVRRWSTVGESSPTGWPLRDTTTGAAAEPYETTLTDGATRIVASYDASQLLTSRRTETSTGSGSATVQELAFRYPEVPGSRPEQLPPNFNRPVETTLVHHDRAGGQRQVREGQTFDDLGRMTTRTDTIHPDDGSAPTVTTTGYEYDHLNRLTASTIRDGDSADAPVSSRTEYILNVSGDITDEAVTTTDGSITTRRFAYDTTGELTAITTIQADGTNTTATQTYDPAGNLTRAYDGTTYTYDPLNRPVAQATPEGDTIATEYWADGSRKQLTTTTVDGRTDSTGFYWDGASLINDTHTTGADTAGTAAYLIGGTRAARTTIDHTGAVSTSYSTHDRHQNVTELTDEHGAVTIRYAYSDYGVTTEHPARGVEPPGCGLTRNPFQYAGEYTDCTGTQYLRARIYDPPTARFISLDPTPLHNRFAYGDANPITNIDPSGHIATADLINYLVIGVTVAFAAFTIGTAIWTGGMSVGMGAFAANAAKAGWQWKAAFALNAAGAAADVLGALTATALVINDHMPDFGGESFLPGTSREYLGYADYALAGVGLVGVASSAGFVMIVRMAKREARAYERTQKYIAERMVQTSEFLRSPLLKVHASVKQQYYQDTALYTSLDRAADTFISAGNAFDERLGSMSAWLKTWAPRFKQAEDEIAAARTTLKQMIDETDIGDTSKDLATVDLHTGLFALGPENHPWMKARLDRVKPPKPAVEPTLSSTVVSEH